MSDTHLGEWRPVPGEPGCEFRLVCRVRAVDGQPGVMDYEVYVDVRRAYEGSEAAGRRVG